MSGRVIPIVQPGPGPGPGHITRLVTGIPTLDLALEGGLPLASTVEISGKAHAGKTTLALQVLGQAQRAGLRATYICGTALPPAHYLEACGIDVDALSMPGAEGTATLESALEAAIEVLNLGNTVVVLDPLPAFPMHSEIECFRDAVTDDRKKRRAQILDVAYAAISSLLRRRPQGLLILVNQQRYNTGVLFGSPWKPVMHEITGHFQVRLDLARVQALKQDGEITGSRIRVRVKKNAGSTPFTEATFDIVHHSGPDFWGNVLDLALVQGFITQVNSHYEVDGLPVGRTRDQVRVRLLEAEDKMQQLIAQLELPSPVNLARPVNLALPANLAV